MSLFESVRLPAQAGGCTHRKAGVGQGANRRLNHGIKKNTDREA